MAIVDDTAVYGRVGRARRRFNCCDTDFEIEAAGFRADAAVKRAEAVATEIESRLNAFDTASAVTTLAETGVVTDPHVAAVVERGQEYTARTDGRFDIRHGAHAHAVKSYIAGERDAAPTDVDPGEEAAITVEQDRVEAAVRLDLNGVAKGYIVDKAAEAVAGLGRVSTVDGGGDMTAPLGPVAIESPYGDSTPLSVLDTDWAVATSGSYRRARGETTHLYDAESGSTNTASESVTVVAERDCMEADALATTLATTHPDDAMALANEWDGLEALVVHEGVFYRTDRFTDHVRTAGGG